MASNEPVTPRTPDADECSCKVGRVGRSYDLDDLDAELVSRWRGDEGEQSSLRDLEAYINRRVLAGAMHGAGVDTLDGEVENVYRLLTGNDVSEGERTEVRKRLERQGVDVDAVETDFVSHQSVHTHLRKCLDVSYERAEAEPAERRDKVRETVSALGNRAEAVTANSLSQLSAADALAVDEFDVFVDVSVTCRGCGRVYSASTLLEQGGCECQSDGQSGATDEEPAD